MNPMKYPPVSRRNAQHYVWGAGCDAWHLLKSRRLSVIEECMPPGSSESRHYHRQSRQFFYILAGQAVLEQGGRRIRLSSRQGLLISPRVRHQIWNSSKKPVRFLVISQPLSHGDRINDPEPQK
jgi:mannose-6-phosphate isomerase-like protein (cupin superfamily)